MFLAIANNPHKVVLLDDMRLNRFILNSNLKSGILKLNDEDLLNQIRNVLKLRVGEKIILSDGSGKEATADIKAYGNDFVEVEAGEPVFNDNESEAYAVLYCSILKRENFELVVQKATEAGIKEIVPIITGRTVKLNVRQDRLAKIIKEASEQSGRGVVPVLREPVDFEESVKAAGENTLNMFFDGSGESFGSPERLNNEGRIGIWIGPEGGWTDKEIELARESGFKIINLGKLTLRAETAAIVASYLIVHNFTCR